MLVKINQQIRVFLEKQQWGAAVQTIAIVIKLLHQADLTQLGALNPNDLKGFISYLLNLAPDKTGYAQKALWLEQAIVVLESLQQTHPQSLLTEKRELHNQLGLLRSGSELVKNKPLMQNAMVRMDFQEIENTLIGMKDLLQALRLAKESGNQNSITKQEEVISSVEEKFLKKLSRYWINERLSFLKGEMKFALQRTVDEFSKTLSLTTQQILKWCRFELFDEARELLNYDLPSVNRCGTFDIHSILSQLISLNEQALSVTPHAKPSGLWLGYNATLQKIRHEAKEQLEKSIDVALVQQTLCIGLRTLCRTLWQDAEALFGPSSLQYCVVLFGSSNRGDVSFYSDIEPGIITCDKNITLYAYLQDMLAWFRFAMEAFGESDAAHSGFHLDACPRVLSVERLESFGIETVENYARWAIDNFAEDNTRLRPCYLFGDEKLLERTLSQLYVSQSVVTKTFLQTIQTLNEAVTQNQNKTPRIVNVKTLQLALSLAITQLCHYFSLPIKNAHPIALLHLLKTHKHLDEYFVAKAISALKTFYRLRFQAMKANGTGSNEQGSVLWSDELATIAEEVLTPMQVLLMRFTDKNEVRISRDIHPYYYPNKIGLRLGVERNKLLWRQQLKSCLWEEGPGNGGVEVHLQTLHTGSGKLNAAIVKAMQTAKWINSDGELSLSQTRAPPPQGINLVYSSGKTSLGFRVFSYNPTIEYAMMLLLHRLLGQVTPFIEVGCLQVQSMRLPILITQVLEGSTVAELSDLPEIASNNFARLFFLSLLVQPLTLSPATILVPSFTLAERGWTVLHTPQCFYPTVLREEGKYTVLCQNMLYALSQMNEEVHPAMREMLLQLMPNTLLEAWLTDLNQEEAAIKRLLTTADIKTYCQDKTLSFLFERAGITADLQEQEVFPIPFREKVVSELSIRLIKLFELLTINKSISYQALLRNIDPMLADYYECLKQQYPKDNERIAMLFNFTTRPNLPVSQAEQPAIQTLQTLEGKPTTLTELSIRRTLSVAQAMDELAITQKQYVSTKAIVQRILANDQMIIADIKKISSDRVKEQIFNDVDWKNINPDFAKPLLRLMKLVSFKKLRIVNCEHLSKKKLEKILKNSPELTSLTLRNVSHFGKTRFLEKLAETNPLLERIHLDELSDLQIQFTKTVQFNRLVELRLSHCVKTDVLKLKAIKLERLILTQQTLQTFEISAPQLVHLDLRGWQQLSPTKLLDNLRLLNCRQIKVLYCDLKPQEKTQALFHACPMLVFIPPEIFMEHQLLLEEVILNRARQVNLARQTLTPAKLQLLAIILECSTTLMSLDLSETNMMDKDIQQLFHALMKNKSLQRLILSQNRLTHVGLRVLTKVLENQRCLIELDVSHNSSLVTQEILVQLEVNRNRRDALFEAIASGNVDSVRALVEENRATLLSETDAGLPPLHLAVSQGQLEIVKILVEDFGVDPRSTNARGKTVADLAPAKHPEEVSHYLQAILAKQQPLTSTHLSTDMTSSSLSTSKPTSFLTLADKDIQLQESLYKEAFCEVYKAHYHGQPLWVKKLLKQDLTQAEQKEFQDECHRLQPLNSIFLLQILGYIDRQYHAFITESFASDTLYRLLQTEKLILLAIRYDIAVQIAEGLFYLHQHHVLHRDLTSFNVLVNSANQAKVCNYGFFKMKEMSAVYDSSKEDSTRWMAPELFEDEGARTLAADIYSVGVILWELSARKKFFANAKTARVPFLINQGKREDIPVETPPKMAALIKSCWAGEPKERPSVTQVLSTLQEERRSYTFKG